jgi:UDP-3-O-[3-hydroxymyristoyl] glucosamine N-acyltransferase
MQVKASEICNWVSGDLVGNPDILISGPSKIEEGKSGTISFLANPKYAHYAYSTKSSVLLVEKNFIPEQKVQATLIKVDNVYVALGKLLERFSIDESLETGISDMAFIDPSASIEESACIAAFAYLNKGVNIGERTKIHTNVYLGDGVKVGRDCVIYPGAKIYRGCVIGNNCIIHANAVIGSDGFGFAAKPDGSFNRIPQIGNVVLEDGVEIGSNTCIDRATMGSTLIRKGVKLDNLIQIGHNVEIDEHTGIAAQAGVAGSTKIGKHVMIGGQAGIVGHIQIEDGAKIQAQSGVAGNVKQKNALLYGSPAIEYSNYLKSYAAFKQLPELVKKIRSLEQKLKEIEENKNQTK